MNYHELPPAEQRAVCTVLNQLCELEAGLDRAGDPERPKRCVQRMKDAFEELQLFYERPEGERFNETRTDVEAHIAGESTEDLRIVEVLKPVIRFGSQASSQIVQKGIVVVKSEKEPHDGRDD